MRQIFLFMVTFSALFIHNSLYATEPSSPTKFIQQDFDVLDYNADINLNKDSKLSNDMKGVCKIKFTWLSDSTNRIFYFNLHKLTVDSVLYNNEKTDFTSIDEQTYSPKEIKSTNKETNELTVYYHGLMQPEKTNNKEDWGGVHATADLVYALGVGFHNNYVSCTRHWIPCYDHPSDKATYQAKFTVPTGYVVASNGKLLANYSENGNDVFEWKHNYQIATYMMTFAAAKFKILGSPYQQIPIQVFTLSSDSAASTWSYSRVPQMHKLYSEKFGTYPFEKIGYVNTTFGHMEHQTMISMAQWKISENYKLKDSITNDVAHELSHQWFGGIVTPLDYRDAWLNESFATFCEPLWIESFLNSKQSYVNDLDSKLFDYFKVSKSEGILSLYDFSRTIPSSNYPETIYKKGAIILATLRYQLGDSLFFGAINYYLNKHRFGNASTEMLIKDFQDYTKLDLSWFFDQWIYRKGWPKINVELKSFITIAPNQFVQECVITQIQDKSYGIYKNLPIEIGFQKPGETKINYQIVTIDSSYTFNINQQVGKCYVNNGPTLRTLLEVGKIEFVIEGAVEEDKTGSMTILNLDNNSGELKFISHYGKYELLVVDINGKVCFKSNVLANDGENLIILPVNSWQSGTYSIILSSNDKYVSKKVIKEN